MKIITDYETYYNLEFIKELLKAPQYALFLQPCTGVYSDLRGFISPGLELSLDIRRIKDAEFFLPFHIVSKPSS